MNESERAYVLLVDDNPGDRLIIKNALSATTWVKCVQEACDPNEALQLLLRRDPQVLIPLPDLIICDLNMPQGGGIHVIDSVRRNRKLRHVPMVIFSSMAETTSVGSCYEQGANMYLRKPEDLTALQRMMEELGNFWRSKRTKVRAPVKERLNRWWEAQRRTIVTRRETLNGGRDSQPKAKAPENQQ